jgi:hypothetical protein
MERSETKLVPSFFICSPGRRVARIVLTGPAKSTLAAHACLALLKGGETAIFAAITGILGAPICASRCLRQHCRYHHKRRDDNLRSKAHREPPDLEPNIYTPSALLAHGPFESLNKSQESKSAGGNSR